MWMVRNRDSTSGGAADRDGHLGWMLVPWRVKRMRWGVWWPGCERGRPVTCAEGDGERRRLLPAEFSLELYALQSQGFSMSVIS